MKENITYSHDLKYFFDLCERANSNNLLAQFNLAKFYLHINRENTNKKAFSLLKKLSNQSYNAVLTNAQYMLATVCDCKYNLRVVGLTMMCYRDGKANKACFGERRLRGHIGKLL